MCGHTAEGVATLWDLEQQAFAGSPAAMCPECVPVVCRPDGLTLDSVRAERQGRELP